MPVPSQTPVVSYVANGSVDTFTYPFLIPSEVALQVTINDIPQASGFTVTGVGNASGGSITFAVKPAAGSRVRMYRRIPRERATDYTEGGALRADTLDADFDAVVMMIQDVEGTTPDILTNHEERISAYESQVPLVGDLVGVGTSAPTHKLTVSSTTADKLSLSYPGFGSAQFGVDSSGSLIIKADEANTQASTQVVVRTDGAERLRIDSSGNVGIGTSLPAARLHLSTSTAADTVIRLDRNSTERASLSAVFDGLQLNGAQVVRFATGNTERARLDTSGNLGIGTASPTAILHTKTAGGEGLRIQGTASSAIIRFTDAADTSTAFIGQNTTFDLFNQASTAMRFGTGNTERMRIDNVGNVGIGSTNPSSKLEVSNGVNSNGALKVSGTATTAGNFASMNFVTGTAPWTVGTEAGNGRFFIYNNAAAMDQIGFGGGTNSSVTLTAAGSTAAFVVNTNGAERMRIDAGGQLGLGTNSPGYRLDVDHAGGVARFRNGTTGYGSIALGASATASQNFQLSSDGSGNLIVYRGIPGSGTEQVRVDTAGNLGVGGTATNYTGSGYDSIAVNGSTGGILEFQSAGVQAARITGWSNSLAVHTNNVERLRIDSSGNLSLGASSTAARLLVQGSGAQETAVVQHGGTNHSIININQSDPLGTNPSFRPILSFRKGGTTSFNLSVDGSSQGLTFYEAYSATAAHAFVTNSVERLRIDGTGKVGIGTNAPAVSLHVNSTDAVRLPVGTVAQRPAASALGDIRYNSEGAYFEGYGSGGWTAFGNASGGFTGIFQKSGTNAVIAIDQTDAAGAGTSAVRPVLSLRKAGTEVFKVSSNGSTTSPGDTSYEALGTGARHSFITNGQTLGEFVYDSFSGSYANFPGSLRKAGSEVPKTSGWFDGYGITTGATTFVLSIPTWARKITLTLQNVSTNGTSPLLVQLGTPGGFKTTGYTGVFNSIANATATASTASTAGFVASAGAVASTTRQGTVLLTRGGSGWTYTATVSTSTGVITIGSGFLAINEGVELLNQIRLTTVNGTDTFNGVGSVIAMVEGV